jgi:beta-carotene 15,15'-dioxygenase
VKVGLRFQSVAFLLASLATVLVSILAPRLPQTLELFIVAVCIVLLGVPHGALDTVFARRRFSLSTRLGWCRFLLVYVALIASVILLWHLAPTLFLVGFLSISGAHFSGDPISGTPPILRTLQGGGLLFLPTIRHRNELTDLYGLLVGSDAATTVVSWLSIAAWPWLPALVVCAAICFPKAKLASLELIAAGCLSLIASPLLAFTVYFCLMHSARHIVRTYAYAESAKYRNVFTSAIAPMLGVVGCGVVAWYVFDDRLMHTALIVQVLFVGLAALTVPHMALIEPIRSAGWQDHQLG